ncbi:MAG: hypothetical protein K9K67_00935 [Bacteriovoracaceae bacterium]|nr:hypothetical protein [Bacteriovoracaceae bacterium]
MTKVLYFLCSPSFGILDNWLPVISSLKTIAPEICIKMIVPKPGNILHLDYESPLLKISNKYFDEILIKSFGNGYLRYSDFEQAQKSTLTNKIPIRLPFLGGNRPIQKAKLYLNQMLNSLESLNQKLTLRKLHFSFKDFDDESSILLFDIYEEHKQYNEEIIKLFDKSIKFSICHGIDINQDPIIPKKHDRKRATSLTCFLYSKEEIEYYQKTFSLHDSNLLITGIPRHSKDWSNSLIQDFPPKTNWDNYVFLISRSYCDYFPPDRKQEAIANLKKVIIDEFELKLIIKLHPKETNDGIYEKILGKENYGKSWQITKDHPFSISTKAIFAVSFYSGVAVDMIYLGVPCIEYLDLRKLPGFDNSTSLRDRSGEPVLSFRFLDLAIGTSDLGSFREACKRVIANRAEAVNKLKDRYKSLFVISEDNREKVVSEIIKALDT